MSLRDVVLQERFLAPGEVSELDMFKRVADFVGNNKQEKKEFYEIMSNLDFLPNTPTLVNAGRKESSGQLAACFVLPIEDSMEGIFQTLKDMAIIQKTGGGVGYSFSRLRPKNDPVHSSLGTSSGPISFMKAYDAATDTIKQGGVRRGANMGVLRVDHPDIEEFIKCKEDLTQLNNFNISVGITDAFMNAVMEDGHWHLVFGDKVYKTIRARELFDKICEQAWKTGEPGIVFLDRINEAHPIYEEIEATNPCGEQPLLPYEACNLGSINLSNHVKNDKIDFKKLSKTIYTAVRFLDNVIDKNKYPLPQIEERVKQNRKIGLGVMGYADMLIKLGLVYGSPDALDVTITLADYIKFTAERASAKLSTERGEFPNFKNSQWDIPMRNATVTTIAPTGTISIIAKCSGGIEPIFSPYYFTNRMDRQFLEIHPLFESLLKEKGLLSDFLNIMKEYKDDLSKFDLSKFDAELHRLFVPAHSITPEQHIQVQSIWQKYTHNAVSKTINLPSSATVNDVKSAYMDAFNKGCKGVTVYRDGSRGYAVLSTKNSERENKPRVKERDLWQSGVTTKVPTGCGKLWITINEDSEGNVNEVFIRNGDDGGCPNIEGEARLISLALRSGIPLEDVLDQLSSVKCPRSIASKRTQAKSCSDAVARTIREYLDIKSGTNTVKNSESENVCPNCGESLGAGNMVEGCITCRNCGWSQCG